MNTTTTTTPTADRRPGLWARIRAAARYLRDAEPAMVQATAKGLLGLLVLWGVGLPAGLEDKVLLTISGGYALLALWQGKATRERVYAPVTVEQRAAELAATRQVQVQVGRTGGGFPPA